MNQIILHPAFHKNEQDPLTTGFKAENQLSSIRLTGRQLLVLLAHQNGYPLLSERKRKASMNDIPPEICQEMLSFMDAESLKNAREVCREWSEMSMNDEYWRLHCIRDLGVDPESLNPPPSHPKQLYASMYSARQRLFEDMLIREQINMAQSLFRVPVDIGISILMQM